RVGHARTGRARQEKDSLVADAFSARQFYFAAARRKRAACCTRPSCTTFVGQIVSEPIVHPKHYVRRAIAELLGPATKVVGLLGKLGVHVAEIDRPVTRQAIFQTESGAKP